MNLGLAIISAVLCVLAYGAVAYSLVWLLADFLGWDCPFAFLLAFVGPMLLMGIVVYFLGIKI